MTAGRHIRFTAVLVAVVFALTGFSSHGGSSSSGSGGKSKSSSSGGGGCSSSKTKKKSRTSGNGSTASASASASASPTGDPATAVVVTCAGPRQATTTVRFTSRLDRRANVKVDLYREDATGTVLASSVVRVTLEARETRTVDVPLEDPSHAAEVKNCRLGSPETDTATTTAGPTPTGGSGTSTSTPKPRATPKPTKSKR